MNVCICIVYKDDSQLRLQVTRSDTIFIPCLPVLGTTYTVWKIDDSLYPLFELPLYHTHQSGGLVVSNISESTGSNYTCYSVFNNLLQKHFDIYLVFSDPGSAQSGYQLSALDFYNTHELLLVSNGVFLHCAANYRFQFRISNVTQDNNYCRPGNVTFTMNVTDGVQSLWSNRTNKYLPSFLPPKKTFGTQYAEVNGVNSSNKVCSQLNHILKVDLDGNFKTEVAL